MKRIVSMFRAILKFGMPLSLLLVPALAIYGSLTPWPPIQSALDRYAGQTPLLVGASYQARYTDTGNTVSASRSYVMIPSVFSDPKLVTFSQHNQGQVVVAQSRSGLFFLIGWWVLCLLGIWWFWLRRVPPNNSFKPNPLRGSA
jgi:hypothetical protein